ncbi:hypothetical protein VPH35_087859 [Triticum aestivum]
MGLWNYGRKGKHDREAGSSSGRRRVSVKKEEPASPSPSLPRRAPSPPAFSIAPASAGERDRHYIHASVCRRYWETRTPIPWSNAHLPNNWYLSADRVPIPPVPVTGRARRQEIERRCRLLPDDLYYDPRLVRGLTPTPSPSPSPSPPPPPRMTAEDEARLVQRVMEDSMSTHDERQWDGLEEAMALSAAGDVAFPELQMAALTEERREDAMEEEPSAAFQQLVGTGWPWSCSAPEMAAGMGVNWRATPPQSPEREASPWEEVLQAPPAVQPAPVYHAPPSHLWTPPDYVDLVSDDDDIGDL